MRIKIFHHQSFVTSLYVNSTLQTLLRVQFPRVIKVSKGGNTIEEEIRQRKLLYVIAALINPSVSESCITHSFNIQNKIYE